MLLLTTANSWADAANPNVRNFELDIKSLNPFRRFRETSYGTMKFDNSGVTVNYYTIKYIFNYKIKGLCKIIY